MVRTSKLLLLAALLSLGTIHALSQSLLAVPELHPIFQRFGATGQTITCSSNDGRRNFCNADTRRGVRLSRQISGSACVQSQTWGFDNRGIWVDRGCRAEFLIGGGNVNFGGRTITCSSNNGSRNYCDLGGANPNSVTLTRQISGSQCNRGSTWGVNNRGLWVDRGCRAEFSIGGSGGGGFNPGNRPGQMQTITCSSNNGNRNFCSLNGGDPGSVTLSRQLSGSGCVRGSTWGVDPRGLWVDRGCRAEFQVRMR
jgi:hypothetical protein